MYSKVTVPTYGPTAGCWEHQEWHLELLRNTLNRGPMGRVEKHRSSWLDGSLVNVICVWDYDTTKRQASRSPGHVALQHLLPRFVCFVCGHLRMYSEIRDTTRCHYAAPPQALIASLGTALLPPVFRLRNPLPSLIAQAKITTARNPFPQLTYISLVNEI